MEVHRCGEFDHFRLSYVVTPQGGKVLVENNFGALHVAKISPQDTKLIVSFYAIFVLSKNQTM